MPHYHHHHQRLLPVPLLYSLRQSLTNPFIAPTCKETVQIFNMGIMQYLRTEPHQSANPNPNHDDDGRWALFDKNSKSHIGTGSLLRLTYHNSRTASSPVTFTGVLISLNRNRGDPTILVRGIIDNVGVEQIFCLRSPLLEKIEVIKATPHNTYKKLYSLRENPNDILKLQKTVKSHDHSKLNSTKSLIKK